MGGDIDEGRLFYFGIFPEERGKGYSKYLHLQSLHFLKEMGATYYIGWLIKKCSEFLRKVTVPLNPIQKPISSIFRGLSI